MQDDYVEIVWDNINPDFLFQFTKLSPVFIDLLNTPYDYGPLIKEHFGKSYGHNTSLFSKTY